METFLIDASLNGNEVALLVDTGADYSVAPASHLVGLEQFGSQRVALADGSIRTWPKYYARIKIGDVVGISVFLGGDAPDKFILGMLAMHELGLCVDTVAKRLVSVDCVMACQTVVGRSKAKQNVA